MYKKVLLFAGTTEGRQLCEYLMELKIESVVYVATEYGTQFLSFLGPIIQIKVGRLTEAEMEEEFEKQKPELVIDATHPYAVLASKNIKEACEKKKFTYIRIVRNSLSKEENGIYLPDMKQAAIWLNQQKEGNILVTTGTKSLSELVVAIKDKERLIVRILPNSSMLGFCEELGLLGKQIICMQGPFSEEMNYLIMKEKKIRYLLTKESGIQGGFQEKINAAERLKAIILIIKRPEETGYSIEMVKEMLLK